MNKKTALITGFTGQDGSYLAEHLLANDYKVYGLVRRTSQNSMRNVEHLLKHTDLVEVVEGDVTDAGCMHRVVGLIEPDEVYNLAAQSFVGESWQEPSLTLDVNTRGLLNLLEAVRNESSFKTRVYQASTSEMFGTNVPHDGFQRESTPFHPRSPYGVSKLAAHWTAINYRESYRMFVCCGILMNHESPRRGEQFVTRKIAKAVAAIKRGTEDELRLGNITARRDWGHAKDYVEAMHLMLQQDEPEDYVVATGETHSVREFLEMAFARVGLNCDDWLVSDPSLMRPAEVPMLRGDIKKIRNLLGWEPKITFEQLVHEMVDSEMNKALITQQ